MVDPSVSGRRRARAPRSVRRADVLAAYWSVTSLVALAGPVLCAVTLVIDRAAGNAGLLDFLVVSPDSARTILGSIAGSLITIASLTASLTIVTLQLLSNQYTPRAVRGFLRRRVSQVVSGAFIGIFLYCLLLLVAVREPGDENEPFVPSLGVTVAIALAMLGLVLLVLFINSLANTIQVSTMTSEIARDTVRAIASSHPEPFRPPVPARDGRAGPSAEMALGEAADAATDVGATTTGYVRRISVDGVLSALPAGGSAVEVLARPGDFVTEGSPVLRLRGEPVPDADTGRRLARTVQIGVERDIDQDPLFGVRQLVDIALRALSPGINDPTTAVTCLGYLRRILEVLAERDLPARQRVADPSGAVAEIAGVTFTDYLLLVVEIAGDARGDARVTAVLLETLVVTAAACDRVGAADRRDLVADAVADLATAARADARTDLDRQRIDRAVAPLS